MRTLKNIILCLGISVLLVSCLDDSRERSHEENTNKNTTLFESGHVRPLAMSEDGHWLFAVNTPAGSLEILQVGETSVSLYSSVKVGMDPVSVAIKDKNEVWVVNHISDSVSIIRHEGTEWKVVNTLLIGDEPRDIVFAKADNNMPLRAYITSAHRGQNSIIDPQLTTPGVGRADVWVFDTEKVEKGVQDGGHPETILTLFTDTPRALAVSNDGNTVFAAGFLTGNQTTVIPEEVVTKTLGLPAPITNFEGNTQPPTSLIVKYNGSKWVDGENRDWSDKVRFSLPDKDVFAIDNTKNTPVLIKSYKGVGTVLYNMAVNPKNGMIFVTNTDARNHERFEGPGNFSGHSLRGRFIENRISIISSDGSVKHRNLNKHIDSSVACCDVDNPKVKSKSLALPTDLVFTKDGKTLYVAAFGSSKIGVFNTKKLVDDSFVPNVESQIKLNGGGPSGVILDDTQRRLFVLTRFKNQVEIVDLKTNKIVETVQLDSPEPSSVIEGRPFLYEASITSANGDHACGSCHVYGDMDGLAWDLGNPDNTEKQNPGPFTLHPSTVGIEMNTNFFPLKGPMVTQSLRGMANHGPMHWRGDRTGGDTEKSQQPNSGTYDEIKAFEQFNDAFVALNGRDSELEPTKLKAFTNFVLDISYPPNPIRQLNNQLTTSEQRGHDFYFNRISDQLFACNGCHVLDPEGNEKYGVDKPGFFGTDGSYSFEFEPQIMKIPHFRNLYQKVGMFGMPPISKLLTDEGNEQNYFRGDQIRGFGFQHDGSVDTIERFISSTLFRFVKPVPDVTSGNPGGFSLDPKEGMRQRRDMEEFLLAFDTNMAPIVGQQITIKHSNLNQTIKRVRLLENRSLEGECDLVARTNKGHTYQYIDGSYSRIGVKSKNINDVSELVGINDTIITYTCYPSGSGSSYLKTTD